MSNLNFRPASQAFLDPDRIDADLRRDLPAPVLSHLDLKHQLLMAAGTSAGPEAIIEASHALEHFDDELWCEPYHELRDSDA